MTDLLVFLRQRLDADERVAKWAMDGPWRLHYVRNGDGGGLWQLNGTSGTRSVARIPDSGQNEGTVRHIALHDPDRVLREVAAKRLLLDEHLPQWRTVEWDHDQNGKGEALCCPRCQNAEHSEWNPPLGQATGLLEGFVTPYVLAPCRTLRALALPFDQHPGYREEWRS